MNQTEANEKILELMNHKFLFKKEIELFKELLFQCDLKIQNNFGYTPFMYALRYNQDQILNLNLNKEQINYLIKNSDLTQQDHFGYRSLMYALKYNKDKNLQLSQKQFQEMYAALNEDQQQTTFKYWIINLENKNNYLEELNILLYDCEFKPNEETMNWLKKNKHQDIIQVIEKKNLFFQLNEEINCNEKSNNKLKNIKI